METARIQKAKELLSRALVLVRQAHDELNSSATSDYKDLQYKRHKCAQIDDIADELERFEFHLE